MSNDARLAAILGTVEPRLRTLARQADAVDVSHVTAADPLDRLALQAAHLARSLDLPVDDTPLLRALTDAERRVVGGQARTIAQARAWLEPIVAAHPVSAGFHASYLERLAPAMLPLSAMNTQFLADPPHRSGVPLDQQKQFLAFLASRCSDARYAAIQAEFLHYRNLWVLAQRGGKELVTAEKYLYAATFGIHKLGTARRIELHARPGRAVLDLGSGPGHFGLVCQFLGHSYFGLDIATRPQSPFSTHDIYADLFELFGLERALQKITAFTPLEVPRRFDMVTCLMGVFCSTRTDAGTVAWQWPEWHFFLRDLIERVLMPRFEVYLQINQQYFAPEVQAKLRTLGVEVDSERWAARITHEQADAIVRAS